MKTIIAGSRNITDFSTVCEAIDESGFQVTEVVSGKARGVDTLGEKWAKVVGVPVKEFPADWEKFGKAAGPIRNKQMGIYSDCAIVIYNPEISKGSKNMIDTMKKLGKPVYEVVI